MYGRNYYYYLSIPIIQRTIVFTHHVLLPVFWETRDVCCVNPNSNDFKIKRGIPGAQLSMRSFCFLSLDIFPPGLRPLDSFFLCVSVPHQLFKPFISWMLLSQLPCLSLSLCNEGWLHSVLNGSETSVLLHFCLYIQVLVWTDNAEADWSSSSYVSWRQKSLKVLKRDTSDHSNASR